MLLRSARTLRTFGPLTDRLRAPTWHNGVRITIMCPFLVEAKFLQDRSLCPVLAYEPSSLPDAFRRAVEIKMKTISPQAQLSSGRVARSRTIIQEMMRNNHGSSIKYTSYEPLCASMYCHPRARL